MSEVTIDFIEGLVRRYPRLEVIFDEHDSDNFGEVLPHLFFGDLTRYLVSKFLEVESGDGPQGTEDKPELRGLLNDLEDVYAGGDEEIQELISVSFLENLPRPEEEGSGLDEPGSDLSYRRSSSWSGIHRASDLLWEVSFLTCGS
jgi:hypothetical protein